MIEFLLSTLILKSNILKENVPFLWIDQIRIRHNDKPTLITLLRVPYLSRIGSTKIVLPKWHKNVLLIELSEYLNNIFGLKMIVKSSLEKIFLKILHAHTIAQCLTWYYGYFLGYLFGSIWKTLVSPNHTNENILRYRC